MKLEYTYHVSIDGKVSASFMIHEPYGMLNYLLQLDTALIAEVLNKMEALNSGAIDRISEWGHDLCLVTCFRDESVLDFTGYDQDGEVATKEIKVPTKQLQRLLSDWIKLC